MKHFEFATSLVLLVIAILWFKNLSDSGFPYEPTALFIGGLLSLVDSIRRFGVFSRVNFSVQNAKIRPWVFVGGKVDKTDISVELTVENNTEKDLLIRAIELQCPDAVTSALGKCNDRLRLVDMIELKKDIPLPINVPRKSSKVIFVESTHDASEIEKYTQATRMGCLKLTESFDLHVTYTVGSVEKAGSLTFVIETLKLLSVVRLKYEESGDYRGVKLLEST